MDLDCARRAMLKRVAGAAIGIAPITSMAMSFGKRWSDQIDLSISTVDDEGAPVPFARTWAYVLPRSNPLAIGREDLRRVAARCGRSMEFVLQVSGQLPVPYLLVLPSMNERGIAKLAVSYRRLEGSLARRPKQLEIGLLVSKSGYFPGEATFVVEDETTISSRVVLKRNPSEATSTKPYQIEFDRLQYELSDDSWIEKISIESAQKCDAFRVALESVASDALGASDAAVAARIHARMQTLPAIEFINGKPAGFIRVDPYSEWSWNHLVRAYELDPDNPYIAAEYMFRVGSSRFAKYSRDRADAQLRRDFEAFFASIEDLMSRFGDELWPTFHELYAHLYLKRGHQGDQERALSLVNELYAAEPKFKSRHDLLWSFPESTRS